jgi:hypothetical protein
MQFETKITLVDLKVILNNMMLIKLRVAVKRNGSDLLEDCSVVDFNERTECFTVVYRDNRAPVVLEIPVRQIELIEFESFYTYRGVSAKTFILE